MKLPNIFATFFIPTLFFPTSYNNTPTPRDLLSSHWQLRLHLIWKVANPLYIDVRLVAHGQVTVQINNQ